MSDIDIEKYAALARIELSEEEKKSLHSDMLGILSYVEKIQEVETNEDVGNSSVIKNVLREDAVPHEAGVYTERLLEEAPDTEDGYVKVKNIL